MAEKRKRKVKNYNFFSIFNWYLPGIGQVLVLALMLIVGGVIGNAVTLGICSAFGYETGVEYAMLLAYPVMFVPAMLYASARSRIASYSAAGAKLDSNNFGKLGGLAAALLAVAGIISCGFVIDPLSAIMPEMPESIERMLNNMTQGILWVNLICVSIFAPLFEEWLCRGMVLRGLLYGGKMKPVWAIVISALFFALIHLNLWQAVPAFLMGCLLGYVYYKTGSLKLTMLMHCANNTISLLISQNPSLNEADNWYQILPLPAYLLLIAVCAAILVLTIRAFKRIPKKSEEGNCDTIPSMFESELQ